MVGVAYTLDSDPGEWIPNASNDRWPTIWSDVICVQIDWTNAYCDLQRICVWWQLVPCIAK